MWIGFILASACVLAFYDLAKKASVRENAVLPVLLISALCGAIAYIGGLAAAGSLVSSVACDGRTFALTGVKTLIVATSWILTYTALKTLPITIATPIRASAPALVFLVAFFLDGERPTLVQALGMFCVFVGYWAFNWAGRHEGIDFLRNRAVWFALGGMACSAASSLWDKYLFQVAALKVETVQFWFQVDLVCFYGLLLAGQRLLGVACAPFEWRRTIPLVGVLLALADWLYFHGLAFPDVPISVASLMRRFSVVITFALGAVFFHERNLRRKSLALVAILVGVALLCVRSACDRG